jgi:hypothetical protein
MEFKSYFVIDSAANNRPENTPPPPPHMAFHSVLHAKGSRDSVGRTETTLRAERSGV